MKNKVQLRMDVVSQLNDVLSKAEITTIEGLSALVWLASLAAIQEGITKQEFLEATGKIHAMVEDDERKHARELN